MCIDANLDRRKRVVQNPGSRSRSGAGESAATFASVGYPAGPAVTGAGETAFTFASGYAAGATLATAVGGSEGAYYVYTDGSTGLLLLLVVGLYMDPNEGMLPLLPMLWLGRSMLPDQRAKVNKHNQMRWSI